MAFAQRLASWLHHRGWGGGAQPLAGDQEQSKINLVHNVPLGWALFLELSNTDTRVSNLKRTLCTFKSQRAKPNEPTADGGDRGRFQNEGLGSGHRPGGPGVGQTPGSLPPSQGAASRVSPPLLPSHALPTGPGEAAPEPPSTCSAPGGGVRSLAVSELPRAPPHPRFTASRHVPPPSFPNPGSRAGGQQRGGGAEPARPVVHLGHPRRASEWTAQPESPKSPSPTPNRPGRQGARPRGACDRWKETGRGGSSSPSPPRAGPSSPRTPSFASRRLSGATDTASVGEGSVSTVCLLRTLLVTRPPSKGAQGR